MITLCLESSYDNKDGEYDDDYIPVGDDNASVDEENGDDNDETSIDNDGEFDADEKDITWHFLLQSTPHSPLAQVVQPLPVS